MKMLHGQSVRSERGSADPQNSHHGLGPLGWIDLIGFAGVDCGTLYITRLKSEWMKRKTSVRSHFTPFPMCV